MAVVQAESAGDQMSEDTNRSILSADGISYAYPNCAEVFRDISLSISTGEIMSILGPNGAGKTTLLNCLANLNPVSSGDIFLDGKSIRGMSPKAVAQMIGYVPQMILPSFDFSVMDYVVTGCAPRMGTFEKPKDEHYAIAADAIHQMGIEYLMEKSYMHVSGGERQQIAIARVLAQRPRFILMDEPTAHLDYGNQIKVLITIKKLAEQGYGIILTTHNPDYCLLLGGKLAVLDRQGKLNFGNSEEILSQETLSSLYKTPLKVIEEERIGRKICVAPRLEEIINEYNG